MILKNSIIVFIESILFNAYYLSIYNKYNSYISHIISFDRTLDSRFLALFEKSQYQLRNGENFFG